MKAIFRNSTEVTHSHLNNVISRDDYRPVMCGVYVDLINKRLVCTDAHVLIMYPIELKFDKEIEHPQNVEFSPEDCKIVPTELFNKNKYMGNWKNYCFPFEYHLDEDYARVFAGPEEVFKCRYIEGSYPKYEAVLLDNKNKQPLDDIGLNLEILARLSKAVPRGTKAFRFIFHARNRAVNLEELNAMEDEIKALIMPVMISN